ncbi:fasciclin [Actinoalloteichus sp. AHMU CJ021]|nr:fasciclin [Actinoalloteichus sp. AHMU CJ021]
MICVRKAQRHAVVGTLAAVALVAPACSNNEQPADDTATTTTAEQETSAEQSPSPTRDPNSGVTTVDDAFGPGCPDLPQDDEPGSLNAMSEQPVATAVESNPLLTQLTAAINAVPNLADTLNNSQALTVFAPADSAFEQLGEDQLNQLLANPTELEPLLSYHVVGERFDAEELSEAGSVATLQGSHVSVEGSGEDMTVGGAQVLCGNFPTANATVFVVDQVLQPEEGAAPSGESSAPAESEAPGAEEPGGGEPVEEDGEMPVPTN